MSLGQLGCTVSPLQSSGHMTLAQIKQSPEKCWWPRKEDKFVRNEPTESLNVWMSASRGGHNNVSFQGWSSVIGTMFIEVGVEKNRFKQTVYELNNGWSEF